MKRIAILGCENSHADAFLRFIKEKEEFSDVAVVGVYSDDTAAAEALNAKYGVPVMAHFADAVGKIDGLIITARHGDNHYKYAKPYISSGIPMFIDKPITISESEALDFMRELRDNGVKISGGSSLKQDECVRRLRDDALAETDGRTVGGYVRAPIMMENKYGGFYFYSQHLVEMVCSIFGRYPESVEARRNGAQIHVLFHYADYDCVGLYCDNGSLYYAARMAEKGSSGYSIPATNDWYCEELREFYAILTGAMESASYEDFISPVFIMNAIERSLDSGREEAVHAIVL